jgi:hypothetical protein
MMNPLKLLFSKLSEIIGAPPRRQDRSRTIIIQAEPLFQMRTTAKPRSPKLVSIAS